VTAGATPTVVTASDAGSASNAGTNGYFIFDNAGADLGAVYWDATGGAGADAIMIAKLVGVPSLVPSDFHIV